MSIITSETFQIFSVKNSVNKISSSDRKLYHPNNAALGMSAMRAGVTHWQAGEIEVGHGMICKAYAILMVTHGPTHPITKDLEVKTSCQNHDKLSFGFAKK